MADVELTYKGNTIGTLSASGTLTMETEGKYCEDDITLTYTSPGGGGGTGIGVQNAKTILGLIHALENNNYHTGTFTVSSYFPANTESEILDTGYGESYNLMIWIADTAINPYTDNTERLFQNFGQFTKPGTTGADFTVTGGFSFLRYRGNVNAAFFGNRMKSFRVNDGKLYATPAYAQTNYTYFIRNATYRWVAIPY